MSASRKRLSMSDDEILTQAIEIIKQHKRRAIEIDDDAGVSASSSIVDRTEPAYSAELLVEFEQAARLDDVDALKRLLDEDEQGFVPCDMSVMAAALENDNARIVALLVTDGLATPVNWDDLIVDACRAGAFNVLRWMRDDEGRDISAFEHHLLFTNKYECFERLHDGSASRRWCDGTMRLIFVRGDVHLIERAVLEGWCWDEKLCDEAAERNQWSVLLFAEERGLPWNRQQWLKIAKKHSFNSTARWIKRRIASETKE